MTQVDFYILEDVEIDAAYRFACRLISKAISSGAQVLVLTPDRSTADTLDELLWNYPDQRFLPHGLINTPAATGAPVTIAWEDPQHYDGVLINLSSDVPGYFARFDRLVEIVVGANRDEGRRRYKHYRHLGYPLFNHKMDDWEAA